MIYFSIACVGLMLFLGARYLAQSVRHTEPRLSRIEPLIPAICFAAMALGVGIILSAAVASAWSVVS
jgi:hypothetical protein